MSNFAIISNLRSREIAPGVVMRSAHLEKVMVTFVDLGEGAVVPEHSHHHEQITVVISGKLRFRLGEEEALMGPGEAVTIPSGVRHAAVAEGGPCVAYDCWSPVREDYVLD
ncbi:MAG: cupin domain-containing protein [Spirochaetales bacterium]|nr:MAG: cupin domain-containing protein [Spirochaetales bacterium]